MTGAPPDPLRDLAVRTSYNKRASLDVPIFEDKSLSRRTEFVEEALTAIPLVSEVGGAISVLAELLGGLVGDGLRFEPVNDAPLHRSYPSPRGLYPVDIGIEVSGDGAATNYRYDPDHHALLHRSGPHIEKAIEEARIALELDAAFERIAPLYGELAPTLCALETGHILQAIGDIARAHAIGFAASIQAAPLCSLGDIVSSERDGRAHEGRVSLVRIELTGRRRFAPGEARQVRIARRILSDIDRERSAAARAAYAVDGDRTFGREPLADADFAHRSTHSECGDANADERGFAPPHDPRTVRARTGGSFPAGMSGRAMNDEDARALFEALSADPRRLGQSPTDRPTLSFARVRGDGVVEMLRSGTETVETVAGGRAALVDAFGGPFSIDVDTVALFAFFTADWRAVFARSGGWAYPRLLVRAGMMAQTIGDRAAAVGCFARPFRGMIEERIESVFGLDGQLFYTVLIGRPRAANPAFRVGPLTRIAIPECVS